MEGFKIEPLTSIAVRWSLRYQPQARYVRCVGKVHRSLVRKCEYRNSPLIGGHKCEAVAVTIINDIVSIQSSPLLRVFDVGMNISASTWALVWDFSFPSMTLKAFLALISASSTLMKLASVSTLLSPDGRRLV